MKRINIFKTIIALFITFSCASCNNSNVLQPNDVNIVSVSVKDSSVPNEIFVGHFDEAGIKLNVSYSDGTTDEVSVTSSLLPEEYQDYLVTPGSYTVNILYRGQEVTISFKIVNPHYIVNFYAYVDSNEYTLIDSQDVLEHESAFAPSSLKTVHYQDLYYVFKKWDKDFSDITSQLDVYALYTSEQQLHTYNVDVTNSDEITAEWHVGDGVRTLVLSATVDDEEVNVAQLLNDEIFITSSNESVLSVSGLVLNPISSGSVTITISFNDAEKIINLTIKPIKTCIDKYGTVHAGTEDDPLDYKDAMNVAQQMKEASRSTDENDIYIKGVVKYWYFFPGERIGNDNATSWFIEGAADATKPTDLFEMYRITKEDGTSLTDEDIWPGAEVLIKGQIGYYSNQLETTKGTFVRVTGGAQRPEVKLNQVGISAKDTDALAIGEKLLDGDTTWDKYEIIGYTVDYLGKFSGGIYSYMIADSKTETASNKMFGLYGSKTELKYQEKVKVICRIKNYHGTIETTMIESIEVLETGTEWDLT